MAMTLEEATAEVIATDPRYAMTTAMIRGVEHKVFANAPESLRDLQRIGLEVREAAGDERPYLVYENDRISYQRWTSETNRIANALTGEIGVKHGDRIAVAMRNYPEFLTLLMAISSVGAVAVLINAWWTTEELRYGFEDSGARIVFADGPRAERIAPFAAELGVSIISVRDEFAGADDRYADLLANSKDDSWPSVQIDADDDFAVMYSSGSTGHPKGVVLTHRGAISATYSWLMGFSLIPLMADPPPDPDAPKVPQAILVATPLFHVTASHPCFLLSIPLGAKIVMMRKWDPAEACRLIDAEQVTRFIGVPTMAAEIASEAVRQGLTLSSLANLGAGGAKRPAAQVAEQQAALPNAVIASGYGMTETNALGIGIQGEEYLERPDACGRLYPPLQELKIAGPDGKPVPNGELGEIAIKAASQMREYLNKPEATAETIRDGWLFTGDLGWVDDDGYVTIVDRAKNIIIRGGENISGLEVEGAIHKHPKVFEAAVFPVPDDRLGEVVGAAVMVREGEALTAAELTGFLAERIAKFKLPERVWFTDQPLIRGATDKIDRRAIRAACLADDRGAGAGMAEAAA